VTPGSKPPQSFNFALFFFAYYGYVGVFSPYASLYFADKNISATQIGILMSMMQVMRIFGPNLWGWVADHTRRRVLVLRLTSVAAAAIFTGMFWGESFAYFFVLLIVLNLFTSAQGPLSEAQMLSAMHGDLTHYGRLRLWGSVGFIFAVMVSGQLLDIFGITLMPTIALLLLLLVVVAAAGMREEVQQVHPHAMPSVRALLKQREVLAFFASTFLMVAAHAALYVYFSLYLAQIGYSKTVIGMMWSLGVIAEILFFYWQAPIFRRYSLRALMLLSLAVGVVRFALIGFAADSLLLLLFAQLLHAATFGVHHSASVAVLQRWFAGPLQARGQALYISVSYGLGGSLGGLLLSACWDKFGAASVYTLASGLCAIGWVAAWLSFYWQRPMPASIYGRGQA
jgi:PPP family 3-phenylpropionic acid transporter